MPGLQSDCAMAALVSPVKKSRLSLKFFQKKETKRALDFSETPVEEQITAELEGPENLDNEGDQVVPATPECPTHTCERQENLVPFVGLNNLGNTCYLNSILQVLYYCPGFKDGIKKLHNLQSKMKEEAKTDAVKTEVAVKTEEQLEGAEAEVPVSVELLGSFHSLMLSLEQLQSSFLLNPEKHSDRDLATPPRRLLSILRQLNPMYEGYLQHDAQEVLQCILGYIQEACQTIKEQHKGDNSVKKPQDLQVKDPEGPETTTSASTDVTAESLVKDPELEGNPECQVGGKRKSDTEAGNAKKKPRTVKSKIIVTGGGYFTRSKRKSSGDITVETPSEDAKVEEENNNSEGKGDAAPEGPNKKRRSRLSWFKPSGKQPSIFSKFRSLGRISAHVGGRAEGSPEEKGTALSSKAEEAPGKSVKQEEEKTKTVDEDAASFDLMERLFQGELVLRTRCLECEHYSERREDFQNISVPVQEDEPFSPDCSSEISPDPKLELKTVKWAISQFASVERIVGQDKYYCETCNHYTEAERSLLFDKTPEIVTIHLKCFAASSSEMDLYAGLSKVNTPLQTPLTLSLGEWSTRPSKERYELFAVVMHSGVTISSGHYTAFIKMMDLKEARPQKQEDSTEEPKQLREEARPSGVEQEYDDGEVSFSLGPKAHISTGTKTGLLGGQRSISSCELGCSKQANADKASGDGVKRECVVGTGDEGGVPKSGNPGSDAIDGCAVPEETRPSLDSGSLLDYEGKWMLFDDSEVRLFDEKDFLNACSPETSTTSTPYLLFYKKVCQE
ncbi:hypothetical protein GJAV_G00081490 [Gymnothorax javanicus]|nr:hypothetical protein GJAV_G00081490 [Gymnothorax javanicus]